MAVLLPPDPPLADAVAGIGLRPWVAGDVHALATAWADPEIARWCAVPADASDRAAAAWIGGWGARSAAGLALDLVIARGPVEPAPPHTPGRPIQDPVLGEVGVRRLRRPEGGAAVDALELGWWLLGPARGRGAGTAAVSSLVAWARRQGWPEPIVARIDPANQRSGRVARAAGLERRGILRDGRDLWVVP